MSRWTTKGRRKMTHKFKGPQSCLHHYTMPCIFAIPLLYTANCFEMISGTTLEKKRMPFRMLQLHRCIQKCVARCKTSPRRDQLRGVVGQGKRRRLWSSSSRDPPPTPLPPSLAQLLPPSCPPLLPPWTHLWRSATFQFGWGARREQRVIMLLLVS